MKSLGQVLLLLALVGVIGFGALKAIDSTLFEEEEGVATSAANLEQILTSPTAGPKTITQKQAFESTTDDSSTETEAILTCKTTDEIIAKLYDMRMANKDYGLAVDFIQDDTSIPSSQADSFVEFAHQLWELPVDQLTPRKAILEKFNMECEKLDK